MTSPLLLAAEAGGPNDPRTAFDSLRKDLTLVKDVLSPYAWRAYANEFRDKQRADNKLLALNRLPGSGVEPKDGMLEGTPLWQERLDKLMFIEHIKKKLMFAHGLFNTASEFMLRSHAWLVRDDLLGDTFVTFITSVPPSAHEQVDVLQAKLLKARENQQRLEQQLEDFHISAKRDRGHFLERITEHQKRQNARQLCDDILVSWAYRAERGQALELDEAKRVLEARVFALECTNATRADEFEECLRQWTMDMESLTRDRDRFKKLYEKMVKAHEQAMEDLKNSADTAEGRAKMIQVLSVEKQRLTDEVEDLTAQRKKLMQQLSESRVEVARQNKEIKRHMLQFRETEELLLEVRLEVASLEGTQRECLERLDACATVEAALRDDLAVAGGEVVLLLEKSTESQAEFVAERWVRRGVEAERNKALDFARGLEADIVANNSAFERQMADLKERAARELRETIEDLTTKHAAASEKLEARNRMLEREVTIGDDIGSMMPTLNPLAIDDSIVCKVCRKAFVFEGPHEGPGRQVDGDG